MRDISSRILHYFETVVLLGMKPEDLKKVVLFVVIFIATLSVAVVIAVSCYVARKISGELDVLEKGPVH